MLVSCSRSRPDIPLRETYSRYDKTAYGTNVFYTQLEDIFSHNNIRDKKQAFDRTWQEISDTGSLYVCVSKKLLLSQKEADAIIGFVDAGNTMFISSGLIDSLLLTKLGCSISGSDDEFGFRMPLMKNTRVSLHHSIDETQSFYSYFYFPLDRYFDAFDSSNTKVLGFNENGKPDFLVIFLGKGRLYIHCEPRTLGNYFLLQRKNGLYAQQLFTFMPEIPEHVFWDDFYNKRIVSPSGNGDGKNISGLSMLLLYPAMAWAFWLLLAGMLIFILFGGKRRQRIVPEIAPNLNTTIAFTETVGQLYLQKKNNRNLADKMILYLYEHIRNHYFINISLVNDELVGQLSRKSGVPNEDVARLFKIIHAIQHSNDVSDELLLSLNQQIELFTKNKA